MFSFVLTIHHRVHILYRQLLVYCWIRSRVCICIYERVCMYLLVSLTLFISTVSTKTVSANVNNSVSFVSECWRRLVSVCMEHCVSICIPRDHIILDTAHTHIKKQEGKIIQESQKERNIKRTTLYLSFYTKDHIVLLFLWVKINQSDCIRAEWKRWLELINFCVYNKLLCLLFFSSVASTLESKEYHGWMEY